MRGLEEVFGHRENEIFLDSLPLDSIFVKFCFFPHLFCQRGKSILNAEFLYLAILDRFTEYDECMPSRGETCDPVSMRPGIYSVDLFSHFLNTVFSSVYYYLRENDVRGCWQMCYGF